MNKDLMFSSKSAEWETPLEFYKELDSIFHFNLDPAATDENALCEWHLTEEENGLIQSWASHNVFLNPPYGSVIKDWVKKAYEEGQKKDTLVVCLIPARTDTKYFHDYCLKGKIRFLRGRLKFRNKFIDEKKLAPAPFPSMLVVFGDSKNREDFYHVYPKDKK